MTPSSSRSLKITIDGKPYTVEVGDLSTSPVTVIVNGETYQVELERTQGTPKLEAPSAPVTSEPVAPPVKRKPSVTPVGGAGNEVIAPMPGDILDIMVKPGDAVKVGDQICALEAMKMKSAIRAARDGVIASVEVSEGQAVAHGDVIVTFEQD